MESLWEILRIILGSFQIDFGVIWESFWSHFGVILGSWGALGALWGTQEGPKSVQKRQNVDFETV